MRKVVYVKPEGSPNPCVSRALRVAGADFELERDLAAALAAPPSHLLILESPEAMEGQLELLSHATRSTLGGARLLLLSCTRCDESRLGQLMSQGVLTNLLATPEVDDQDLRITLQKLLGGDIFGTEKYFGWGVERRRFELDRSSDREGLFREAEHLGNYLHVQPRLVAQFRTLLEELVNNALFNAPTDRQGRPRFAGLAPGAHVVLEPGERVEVTLACDGRRLAACTADPFGSFSEEHLMQRLGRSFGTRTRSVDREGRSAGLGLSFILGSVNHLVVNLAPGKRTEMLGMMRVDGTYRSFLEGRRSVNLFVAPPDRTAQSTDTRTSLALRSGE